METSTSVDGGTADLSHFGAGNLEREARDVVFTPAGVDHILHCAFYKASDGEEAYRAAMAVGTAEEQPLLFRSLLDPLPHITIKLSGDRIQQLRDDGILYSEEKTALQDLIGCAMYKETGQPNALPDLSRITVHAPAPDATSTVSYTLAFGREEGEHVLDLVVAPFRRSFNLHLDHDTIRLDPARALALLPIPEGLQHLQVSFPAIVRSEQGGPLRTNNTHANDESQWRVGWVKALIRYLKDRNDPPVVLQVTGAYSAWRPDGRAVSLGKAWDGLLRTRSIDIRDPTSIHDKLRPEVFCTFHDKGWRVIGAKLFNPKLGVQYDSIDQLVDVCAHSWKGADADKPLEAQSLGEVLTVFNKIEASHACLDCGLYFASTTPFEPDAHVPEHESISVRQGNITAYPTSALIR